MSTVVILGVGKMGEAILAGMIKTGQHELIAVEPHYERAEYLRAEYAVPVLQATEAVARAEVVIVAVKPAQVAALLAAVGPAIPADALVISIAAGVSTESLESNLSAATAVVRAMPNTPALLGEGMIAISAGKNCSNEQLSVAQELLGTVGKVVVVPESAQDAVTAVSGSGPAYIFLVAEAMIDAAVSLGLTSTLARDLVNQTIFGAAAMLTSSNSSADELRANVTSPGGTTAAAIEKLEQNQIRQAFKTAMEAAKRRSIELGQQFG